MKYKIIAFLLIIITLSSCQEYLDVNHNPSMTEESRLDLVFPAALESSASVFGGGFMSLGAIWAQHWTSDINKPGFMGEDSYSVQAGDYGYDIYGWGYLYTGTLMDYEWVKQRATEEQNWDYYLAATVMQCYVYQNMADLWDQIPVSDALQVKPATFETGPQVYDVLISRINEALSKLYTDGTAKDLYDSDLIFQGNMNNWVAFANTLKLKMYIRQRFARPTESLEGINELYNSNAAFLNIDATFKDFKDEVGKGNYWYERNLRGGSGALRASNTFLTYLVEKSDPRLDEIFTAPESGHKGIWQGDYRDNFNSYGGGEPDFSAPNMSALDPVYFISASESKFLQAEALMMRGEAATTVEAMYKEAVGLNCARYGVTVADAESSIYGEFGYAAFPVTGTKTEQYEVLMMQKWVAMANGQGLEAFFEHNRTNIPKESPMSPQNDNWDQPTYVSDYLGYFTVSVQGVLAPPERFPKRLLFSATERSKNPNIPATVGLNVPVWWEVANPSVE